MQSPAEEPPRDEALREQAAAWLARIRGGSTEDHAEFEAWYQADPRHAAAYDAVLDNWKTSEKVGQTPFAEARRDLARARAKQRRLAFAALAATVAIVLLAVAAYGAGAGGGPRAPLEFASATSETRTLVLEDGSRVTLYSGSLLRADYSPSERRVELSRGRARFSVAHDPAHPFVVATDAGMIIAHGTVFDVAFDGHQAIVSLIEGSIEVRPRAAGSRFPSSRMLSPGEQVTLSGGEVVPSTLSSHAAGDRADRMVSFENAPLGDVIAAANPSGPGRIRLADPALAQLRFTGSFRLGDAGQLSAVLAAAFDLVLARTDDGTFVLSRSPSRPTR
jgi:transmembrane sensor